MFVFSSNEHDAMIDFMQEEMLDSEINSMMWIGKFGTFFISPDKNKCNIFIKGPDLTKSFGYMGAIREVFH